MFASPGSQAMVRKFSKKWRWDGFRVGMVVGMSTVMTQVPIRSRNQNGTRWWQLKYLLFSPELWGRFPFWIIFFRWVCSTTNYRESWDSFFADVRTKPRLVAGHFQASGVEKNEGWGQSKKNTRKTEMAIDNYELPFLIWSIDTSSKGLIFHSHSHVSFRGVYINSL